ncbi:hypothetical protein CNYM01_05065 [Colletotrichum nymphaeae SA-01]|uniref:Choline transport protein n=1 Tax=Colletotrichum nymphaeae SA-01 TaxID=1460502 RepID=A0A135SBZ5_9PEZI|nr:hypothetical protein CNYM01_05065 [Colletotrichum nymphaeae SA-01]
MAGASTPTTSDEDADLSRLGLQSLAKRDIGPLAIVGLGWNICNSWSAIAATLVISISSGGPVTLLYGIVLIFVLGGACALSMAEIASVYPTAGGQYHWTSILAPRRYSRGLSDSFVWTTFVNESGWSSKGIVFLTGLLNPNFIYSGLDGAIHLAEECTNASSAIPKALISTITIGFVSAFTFSVAMLYSFTDLEPVLSSPLPILEIWSQATGSSAAATTFVIVLSSCGCFACTGALQTASRLTWAFARDNAIVFSPFLCKIHPEMGVPVNALLVNWALIFALGCIFLASSTAFNALVATGLILQQVSFAFPAALALYHRSQGGAAFRRVLPRRKFSMPPLIGAAANILTIVLGLLALVFYDFPVVMPVSASNMNYACVVLGVMGLFSVANWFGLHRPVKVLESF